MTVPRKGVLPIRFPTLGLWANSVFLKLWAAQSISFLGSQFTTLALPLLAVIGIHASVAQMGFLRAVGMAPVLLLGVFVGAIIDRLPQRPVLIIADIGRAMLLVSIPLAEARGVLTMIQLYLVAFLVGVLTIFFDVTHMSLLPALIPRERLVEGNSKLEVSRSIALIAGPGLAGLLVQFLTVALALIVDALSFLGSALFLLRLPTPQIPPRTATRTTFLVEVREGFTFVWHQPLLRAMALSLCAFNFFSGIIGAVYVLYVIRELQLTPALLGLIYTVGSIGFPLGAAFAARTANRFGIGPTIVWGAALLDAAFLLIPAAQGSSWTIIILLSVAQLLAMLAGPLTAINQLSLRQAITPEHLRGRVNGTMRVISMGAAPVGALLAGVLGERIGLRPALIMGVLGLQTGFIILLLSPLRGLREQPPVAIDVQHD